jgi:hypothetical protein
MVLPETAALAARMVMRELRDDDGVVDPSAYGLPILKLTGDTSAMTKDNAVDLQYVYGDRNGTASVKWQGNSSLFYPKKNYTIKFDTAFEAAAGWGEQKKYCLKANYIDHSHARNVVSAKLWGQVVKSRKAKPQPFDITKITHTSNNPISDTNDNAISVSDGVVTFNRTMYEGVGWLYGWTCPAGAYKVTFDCYNPNTQETDPDNRVLVGMGMPGDGDIYYAYASLGEHGTWGTYTANLWPTAKVNGILIAPAPNRSGVNPNYKIKNIIITDVYGNEFEVDPNAKTRTLVNGGAIDGFPCVVMLNGKFHGLYTFNIPKDGWMFGMGEGTNEAIVCADSYCDATRFAGEATLNGDFELEYVTDENDCDWVLPSLNRLITSCNSSDGTDVDTVIADYLDWDSAIDYYIFRSLLNGIDMGGKNYILFTYDGTKWGFSAYDMDCVYGLDADGMKFYSPAHSVEGVISLGIMVVPNLILNYKKDAFVERYKELRKGVMSDSNIEYMFTNFIGKIPTVVYMEESKRWPMIPNTSVNNLNQIVSYYKERAKALDEIVDAF